MASNIKQFWFYRTELELPEAGIRECRHQISQQPVYGRGETTRAGEQAEVRPHFHASRKKLSGLRVGKDVRGREENCFIT